MRLKHLLPAFLVLFGCVTTRSVTPDALPPIQTGKPETTPTAPPAEPEAPTQPETLPPSEPVAEAPAAAEPLPPPRPPREPFTITALTPDRAAAQRARRLGVAALKDKDLVRSVEQLSLCVAHDEKRTDCRWELGWALYLSARWLDARDVWRDVAARRKNDPEVQKALDLVEAHAAVQERLDVSEATPAPPLPTPPEGAQLRLRAVGDVMLGTTFPEGLLPPDDGKHVLDAVRALLEDADVTFVNLEGPLCDSGTSVKCGRRKTGNCYAFRSPTHYVDYLIASGVDVASIANNHVGDFGDVCRRETETTLTAKGIAWSGPPGTVATVERNGLRLGLIAFHTNPATNYVIDITTAERLVREASRTHHLVVVSFHGGAEGATKQRVPEGEEFFHGENRGDLRRFTHAVVDAGADLVLGHGPHVLRGMEIYKDRLIAYSLGNFATYGPFTLSGPQGVGVILEATLRADGSLGAGKLFPTKQVGEGIPEPDSENRALEYIRSLSKEDFPGTAVDVGDDGTLTPGKAPLTLR